MKSKGERISDIIRIIDEHKNKIRDNQEVRIKSVIRICVLKHPSLNVKDIAEIASAKLQKELDEKFVFNVIKGYFYYWGNNQTVTRCKTAKNLAEKLFSALVSDAAIDEFEAIYEKQRKYAANIHLAFMSFVSIIADSENNPQILDNIMSFGQSFSIDCIESIISYIKVDLSTNTSDYEKEILRLESERNRANNLISRLQEEFDERLEESKKEEQDKLVQELNSSRYDCILDQLTSLQNGLKQLRRERIAVPMQINTLQSFVRNMLQFVEDCGITPMMDLGEELEISALDTEYYEYRGNAFNNNSEKKKVVVVATGWENREKNVIISQPTVQEIIDDEVVDIQQEITDDAITVSTEEIHSNIEPIEATCDVPKHEEQKESENVSEQDIYNKEILVNDTDNVDVKLENESKLIESVEDSATSDLVQECSNIITNQEIAINVAEENKYEITTDNQKVCFEETSNENTVEERSQKAEACVLESMPSDNSFMIQHSCSEEITNQESHIDNSKNNDTQSAKHKETNTVSKDNELSNNNIFV